MKTFHLFFLPDVPRNMKDEILVALARNGGVVGVNLGDSFLNQVDAESLKQRIAKRNGLEPGLNGEVLDRFAAADYLESGDSHPKAGHATVSDAAECIDQIAKIAGIDHVESDRILMAFPACLKAWRTYQKCRHSRQRC